MIYSTLENLVYYVTFFVNLPLFFLDFLLKELEVYAGPSFMFKKFSYKETKKATNSFGTIIGQGGFGAVYKAQFSDGSILAVKRMDKVSEQAVEEFCREIELLARLHHRHLVALKGFCIEKHERSLYIMCFFYLLLLELSISSHLLLNGSIWAC